MSNFAQCGSCRFFGKDGMCAILSREVEADMSCGFYAPVYPVAPKDAGLVDRQVRCENCRFFDGEYTCKLFMLLKTSMPNEFEDLDPIVEPEGCCNAQTPIGEDIDTSAFLYLEPRKRPITKIFRKR